MRSDTAKPMSIYEAKRDRFLKIAKQLQKFEELHPLVQSSLSNNRHHARHTAYSGVKENSCSGDYILVTREDFHNAKIIFFCWRAPRRIKQSLREYAFIIEDMRNVYLAENNRSQLKFYHDSSLEGKAII